MGRWSRVEIQGFLTLIATVLGVVVAVMLAVFPSESHRSTTTVVQEPAPIATTPVMAPKSRVKVVKAAYVPPTTNQKTHTYSSPIGTVWVKITPMRSSHARTSVVALSWGAKHRSEQISLGRRPVFLEMNKSGPIAPRSTSLPTPRPRSLLEGQRTLTGG